MHVRAQGLAVARSEKKRANMPELAYVPPESWTDNLKVKLAGDFIPFFDIIGYASKWIFVILSCLMLTGSLFKCCWSLHREYMLRGCTYRMAFALCNSIYHISMIPLDFLRGGYNSVVHKEKDLEPVVLDLQRIQEEQLSMRDQLRDLQVELGHNRGFSNEDGLASASKVVSPPPSYTTEQHSLSPGPNGYTTSNLRFDHLEKAIEDYIHPSAPRHPPLHEHASQRAAPLSAASSVAYSRQPSANPHTPNTWWIRPDAALSCDGTTDDIPSEAAALPPGQPSTSTHRPQTCPTRMTMPPPAPPAPAATAGAAAAVTAAAAAVAQGQPIGGILGATNRPSPLPTSPLPDIGPESFAQRLVEASTENRNLYPTIADRMTDIPTSGPFHDRQVQKRPKQSGMLSIINEASARFIGRARQSQEQGDEETPLTQDQEPPPTVAPPAPPAPPPPRLSTAAPPRAPVAASVATPPDSGTSPPSQPSPATAPNQPSSVVDPEEPVAENLATDPVHRREDR